MGHVIFGYFRTIRCWNRQLKIRQYQYSRGVLWHLWLSTCRHQGPAFSVSLWNSVGKAPEAWVCLNRGDLIWMCLTVQQRSADRLKKNGLGINIWQLSKWSLPLSETWQWQQVKHPNPCLCWWKPRWTALHSTCWLLLAALQCLTGKKSSLQRAGKRSFPPFPQIRSRSRHLSWVSVLTLTPYKW